MMTIKAIQKALGREETGNYDTGTRAALVEFQKHYNAEQEEKGSPQRLRTDGVVDVLTRVALGIETQGGNQVIDIQRALGMPLTNNYDAETREAVVNFAREFNEANAATGKPERIRDDGVVDPKVMAALNAAAATR
jgi:peptidoglycan hydrolase-like protein with peptidoglycan-binding domain